MDRHSQIDVADPQPLNEYFEKLKMQNTNWNLAILLALTGLCSLLNAQYNPVEQWPTWRGGNQRHGSTMAHVTPSATPVWIYQAAAPLRAAWSTAAGKVYEQLLLENRLNYDSAIHPIVVDGKIYFGSSVDHQLQCRDLASGKVLWSMFVDAPIRLAPSYSDGKIYLGSDDGCVYCVDAGNGQLIWKLRAGPTDDRLIARGEMISRWPVRTGVLVDQGLAYFGAGIFPHERVLLYCVDAGTGAAVWVQDHLSELDAGRTGISPQGYLLANDQQLFVPSGRSLPIAVDKSNGELLHSRSHSWRSTAGGVVGGYRALLTQGQMIASGDHNWLAMDQGTGDVGYGWFEGGEFIVQGENAFSVTGKELIKMRLTEYAVNSRKRQELKMKLRDASRSAIPLTEKAKQKLQEQLQEIQNQIDQIADIGVDWRSACDSRSALLATADFVFVGGKGHVTGYSHQSGQIQWKAEIPGEVTGLVAVQDYLMVSNDLGQIHVFGSANDTSSSQPIEAASQQAATGSSDDLYAKAAERIIQSTGIHRGFCLVLDNQQGRLAEELAKRTSLKIYAVDRSLDSVSAARQRLLASGLYGHRISVHHLEADLPYSNYFADLIVSDAYVSSGRLPNYDSLARHLKPVGGKIALPLMPPPNDSSVDTERIQSAEHWLSELGLSHESSVENVSDVLVLKRGPLPGAGSWSHLYGTPANTAIGNETRVKSELGVLWYGDPGPGEMVNRHDGAVGPLATGGRLFVQGDTSISAYDAYNGTLLWKQDNPKAVRTGVFQNQNPGNLAATEDRLFHFIQDECFELDAATGQIVRIHQLPPSKQDGHHQWGYMALAEGYLVGTATVREEVDEKLRRRGRATVDSTDMLFAIELGSGIHAWEYQGENISHHTVAIGPGKVFFIDSSISSQQREEILAQDKSQIALLEGEEKELAERRAKKADIRRAVALELKSGAQLWANPVDVTDCSDIGIGGGKLTLMYHNDTLILGGANANGHFWEQFVSGSFSRRRLVALSADQGYQKWAKDANYKGRPIVVGDKVLAEPWSFNLQTGDQLTREHPTTGQKVPWSLMRTGHHCGILTGCESGLLMFRSGDTAFYDLEADSGTNHFSGHRLGCWINAIPANGLVMIPEASAGCVCQFSIASTIVLEPRPQQYRWTIHSAVGSLTPVQSMAINLGAPGDRRDGNGRIWLSYPRRAAYKETSLGVDLNLQQVLSETGRFRSVTESQVTQSNGILPWVASSWVEGLKQVTIPLLGIDDQPAQYLVKLIVSGTETENSASAASKETHGCQLSVLANGQLSGGEISIPTSPDNNPAATEVALGPFSVKDNLTIEFQVQHSGFRLHGIEVTRTDN